ncbi:putative membrane protein [Candidatus Ichthyocystis hellenicum]|uniref:Putative membrane protein n=1 Tax=Candidatus Ichthyocystis hellenicum TaxID=1561003 RepID=A0A0S4M2G4_9BURK|nr:hypothetical protein [Candidatus Ichthyocystis hellenicum]CUT17809.1 putative membrane protein [Candidatus Ichthyocystis hellenicum]
MSINDNTAGRPPDDISLSIEDEDYASTVGSASSIVTLDCVGIDDFSNTYDHAVIPHLGSGITAGEESQPLSSTEGKVKGKKRKNNSSLTSNNSKCFFAKKVLIFFGIINLFLLIIYVLVSQIKFGNLASGSNKSIMNTTDGGLLNSTNIPESLFSTPQDQQFSSTTKPTRTRKRNTTRAKNAPHNSTTDKKVTSSEKSTAAKTTTASNVDTPSVRPKTTTTTNFTSLKQVTDIKEDINTTINDHNVNLPQASTQASTQARTTTPNLTSPRQMSKVEKEISALINDPDIHMHDYERRELIEYMTDVLENEGTGSDADADADNVKAKIRDIKAEISIIKNQRGKKTEKIGAKNNLRKISADISSMPRVDRYLRSEAIKKGINSIMVETSKVTDINLPLAEEQKTALVQKVFNIIVNSEGDTNTATNISIIIHSYNDRQELDKLLDKITRTPKSRKLTEDIVKFAGKKYKIVKDIVSRLECIQKDIEEINNPNGNHNTKYMAKSSLETMLNGINKKSENKRSEADKIVKSYETLIKAAIQSFDEYYKQYMKEAANKYGKHKRK